MKIISIGDLHGKNCWKQIDFHQYDKAVFIGDYTDSRTLSDAETFSNLSALIDLKKANSEKIILLLGNHDIQYLYFPDFRCSGFRKEAQYDLTNLFRRNKHYFQVAYQHKKYLFTHAGVSQSWFNKHEALIHSYRAKHYSLGTILNAIHDSKKFPVLFEVGYRRGGDAEYGGIVWADASETKNDHLKNIHQIIGHAPVKDITTTGDKKSSITYINVLDFKIEFYELEVD